jgi:2-polyprenyl-3-methyl-5-hydroxy-6-metoxy-1,4-benzoquinol methylase/glycosyltransferase involved in cell wall biosynthesis
MRLAYFSPLRPQRSGIADYSEELLPRLAVDADITLFVDGFQPASRELLARFPVRDFARDPSALRSLEEFDVVVYHMGNDHRYHAGILEALHARPGVVVLHDFALQDFFLGLARERGDLRVYLEEVAACHGEEARREAEQALARGGAPSILARPADFPLNCRIARAAEALIVHSEWARARLAEIAPAVPVAHIPMPVRAPADARRARSNTDGGVHIANFGLITPGKGIEHALRALAALKETHRFRYTLVGEPNNFFDVREMVRRHRLEDRVEITGHVALDEFERRISETDIALNMRERTVGETSASLCRIMAAGVASIVADVGWYSEIPDDCAVKVPLDAHTDALLAAYLRRLIEDDALRARIGENARRHALAEHSIERSAALYLGFLRETIARRPRRNLVASVSKELALLGVGDADADFLRGVAADLDALAPASVFESDAVASDNGHDLGAQAHATGGALESSAHAEVERRAGVSSATPSSNTGGRLPKIEGLDYKRAAIEYTQKLDAERRHYLSTKPFYNLANKPPKHAGDGMDAETFRHFCDFANVAVALALPAGSRLLDVGCGSGWLSEYFARLGYDVTGIDISPELIEIARARLAAVPFDVDHETPLRCRFLVHDAESLPLDEKFDAVVCYDSLHHFEDERAVFRNLAAMTRTGGALFILEGDRPPEGSATEEELIKVMRCYDTLESPFSPEYLRALLDERGFAVVGDYVSVNGLFEREMLEGDRLPLTTLATNYHYLICAKVCDDAPASTVPDSRQPRLLRARITPREDAPALLAPGSTLALALSIENTGDTLWLTGQTVRAGVVMPAFSVFDDAGTLVSEVHGEPLLPRPVAPGETVNIKIEYNVPRRTGAYTLKVDLVDQHVCWFEQQGSEPFLFQFDVL